MKDAISLLDFEDVAKIYRLIDKEAVNVVVPDDGELFEDLRRDLRRAGHPTAHWIRRARSQTVNLYRPDARPSWSRPRPRERGRLSGSC